MTLAVRIIPCLDVANGRVVKGVNFVALRDAGEPVQAKAVGPGKWEIFTYGGRKATGIDAVAYAIEAARLGAGEILLTSMDRDGTKAGYDLALTRIISDAVPVPVVASGGVGGVADLVSGVRDGHASAVLAASIFHFGEVTVAQARAALADAGLPVREVFHGAL